ncbi:MAG: MerR family transcriptional regulator [Thermoleophilaceae bacterium]|nr:MerR family transcriptional regulator [Thermoleophilaceae bacterium]
MAEDDEAITVDELARRTGMTARNIRAHQSRGLLAPPEVRGRTGYYGPEHVARIELIRELQADGFNLDLIKRLVEGAGGSSAEVLGFTRALREPFADEEPRIVEAAELAERWGTVEAELLERAEKLGILRPLGDGRYEETSPRIVQAGSELAELGMSAEEALELLAKVRRNADAVAITFAKVFFDTVWAPFEEAGRPEERWPEVRDSLERLRPLASDSLLAIFRLAMDDAVEKEFGRVLEGRGKRGRKRRTVS